MKFLFVSPLFNVSNICFRFFWQPQKKGLDFMHSIVLFSETVSSRFSCIEVHCLTLCSFGLNATEHLGAGPTERQLAAAAQRQEVDYNLSL